MSAPPVKKTHFVQRAILRYGLDLTNQDHKAMIKIIRSGGSIERPEIPTHEPNRKVHDLVYQNRYWRVVVARNRKIVTVLPL